MAEACGHRPEIGMRAAARIDQDTVAACRRCGQMVRFAGRRPAAFVWLGAAWAAVFAGTFCLLSRSGLARPIPWSTLITCVVTVPPWAILSTLYLSRWEPVSGHAARARRFHSDAL
ncbi:MAG: hypothetical protein IJH78_04945 [Clostridia bacterium]|nr:hypothetical protein [Clostridia bacterium]